MEVRTWLTSAGVGGALIVILAFLGASPALGPNTRFTYDDNAIVRLNHRLALQGPGDLARLATDTYWGKGSQTARLWRPVTLVSLGLERTLRGPHPNGFHRTNVALHGLASLLALLLLRRLLAPRTALFGAALFALHPVHGEAVGGIVGRAEILALIFTLAGTLLHLIGRSREAGPEPKRSRPLGCYAAAATAFFLAFGSKEIALTAPFVLVLVEAALRRNTGTRPCRWPYLGYAAALALYGLVRLSIVGSGLPESAVELSPMLRILLAARGAAESCGAMVLPLFTVGVYPYVPPDPGSVAVWAATAFDLTVLALGAWCLTRRDRRHRMLGLGAVGFFVSLGPVSNLVPIGVVRADRLLYMPSFYACLLMAGVADGAGRWLKDRAPGLAQIFWPSLAALALGMFALRSQANVRAWTDPVALWSSSLQRFPDDPAFQVLLGEALLSTRRPQEALVYLERAAQHPEAPRRAWARLAAAHLELGNLGEVEQTLERAVSDDLAELLLRARYRLLSAMAATDSQARERHLRLGEAAARRAVALQPAHYDLLRVWGNLLGRMPGRANDAEQAFARACALNPDPWYALFDRSRTRLDRGDALRALDDLRAVLASLDARADPALSALRLEVVYDLADAALRVGQTGEAKSALARLRREAPNYRAEQVRSLLERVE